MEIAPGPLSLIGQSPDGYPLYAVAQPSQSPPLASTRAERLQDPLRNEPGGVAHRSAGAGPFDLVEMVLAGLRPAADLLAGNDPQAAKAAAAGASVVGLAVVAVIGRSSLPSSWEPAYLVGRDQDACLKLLEALRLPLGSLAFDLAFGRALGYSEEDVRRYLERRLRQGWPAVEHASLLAEAYQTAAKADHPLEGLTGPARPDRLSL